MKNTLGVRGVDPNVKYRYIRYSDIAISSQVNCKVETTPCGWRVSSLTNVYVYSILRKRGDKAYLKPFQTTTNLDNPSRLTEYLMI